MSTQMFTYQEAALARSRLYTLLQQIYLAGVTEESLPVITALPDLAGRLSAFEPQDPVQILDQMAAAHQELFGYNLFPYESMFLESVGLLNGERSEQVATEYRAFGYEPTARAGAPDHLGEELGALGHLCAAEADAWEDGREMIARRMQREQRHFLQTHLLRWIAPCVIAIQRHGEPFFTELAGLTAELVAAHYAALLPDEPHARGERGTLWVLPEPPSLLQETHTSLKDIAHFLTTPVYCGIFLSRRLINRLGRTQRLPRGFGSREQMLTNLLRTAAHYEALPTLLQEFVQELRSWQQAYGMIWAADVPAQFVQPWSARVDATILLLETIDETVALAQDNPDEETG